jgi:uncharacterized protein YchJ
VIDCIVSAATDMGAVEMLEQINGWFDAGLVDVLYINKAEFEKEVSRPFETYCEAGGTRAKGYVSDVQAEMDWWSGFAEEPVEKMQTIKPVRTEPKVGRNDPCPCGSGKKYKKCHGFN